YYPFGMQMPGRSFAAEKGYRYGFNGKENDQDINIGMLDFGGRMNDVRIAKWFSIDPQSSLLPNFSPYSFVNNDPIRYIDPDGNFLLDVHRRIVRNALFNFQIKFVDERTSGGGMFRDRYLNGSLTAGFSRGIRGEANNWDKWVIIGGYGGVVYPDWHEQDNKSSHFDQMNYAQIMENFNRIKTQTTALIDNYKLSGGIKSDDQAHNLGFEIGKKLHAVADFYSHSNYVELYTEMYGKVKDLSTIPTLDETMSNMKYEKFAEKLKRDLKTGRYPGEGAGSHKEMNHDVGAGSTYTIIAPDTRGKKVSYNTRAAEAVATKASKEYWLKVKNQIEDRKR
ncbi:hypothetical protein EPD60_07555, partial [Flaviaesturariibacter flavus]